ncbi:hypothetical protein Hanom_Chr09g00810591 [Helianthus anomalus]
MNQNQTQNVSYCLPDNQATKQLEPNTYIIKQLNKNNKNESKLNEIYLRNGLPLAVKLLLLSLLPLFLSKHSHPLSSLGIRIQPQHSIQILQRILLHWRPLHLLLNRPHNRLHLIRIDNPRQIGILHLRPGQHIPLLLLTHLINRPVNRIQLLKSRFRPNHKPT